MTTVAERSESATAKTGYLAAAAMVRDWAKKVPDRIALREKDYGIWQETTWAEYWDVVTDAAHGLLALGVELGDRVSSWGLRGSRRILASSRGGLQPFGATNTLSGSSVPLG